MASTRGFDIDRRAIDWCRRTIGAAHPNFWFGHADVANSYYNPRGRTQPTEFRFPVATGSIDLAFASSVFTHLLPPAASRYIGEIGRVLKPGGRAVASFFLLDESVRSRIGDPLVQPQFIHPLDARHSVGSLAEPEIAVGHDEATVRELFAAAGLTIIRTERGSWRALDNPRTYQDLVVARKHPEVDG
jgi:SAM-dependent methyltransferase